jgi:tryptophan synthase alpha chain
MAMKNRIDHLFANKNENILSIFLTAGYPQLIDTPKIIKILNSTQVDLIEVGIPFSDPLADGPIIQESSMAALENGMTLQLIFEQLQTLRTYTQLPILLMGYLNSVMRFGEEKFYKACYEIGIDGVILPDMPLAEYEKIHQSLSEKYNVKVVHIITPETSVERIHKIDANSSGFLYLVSSNSTTGNYKAEAFSLKDSLKTIKSLTLKNPLLIGFGIKGHTEFKEACQYAKGAIIGSSFVKLIGTSKDFEKDIPEFISNIKKISNTVTSGEVEK